MNRVFTILELPVDLAWVKAVCSALMKKDICEWRILSRKLIALLKTGAKRMNRAFFMFPWEKANAMTVIIRMRQSGGFFCRYILDFTKKTFRPAVLR